RYQPRYDRVYANFERCIFGGPIWFPCRQWGNYCDHEKRKDEPESTVFRQCIANLQRIAGITDGNDWAGGKGIADEGFPEFSSSVFGYGKHAIQIPNLSTRGLSKPNRTVRFFLFS